jgi:hypothetical protein
MQEVAGEGGEGRRGSLTNKFNLHVAVVARWCWKETVAHVVRGWTGLRTHPDHRRAVVWTDGVHLVDENIALTLQTCVRVLQRGGSLSVASHRPNAQ